MAARVPGAKLAKLKDLMEAKEALHDVAANMLAAGMTLDTISQVTGLSLTEISAIKQDNH